MELCVTGRHIYTMNMPKQKIHSTQTHTTIYVKHTIDSTNMRIVRIQTHASLADSVRMCVVCCVLCVCRHIEKQQPVFYFIWKWKMYYKTERNGIRTYYIFGVCWMSKAYYRIYDESAVLWCCQLFTFLFIYRTRIGCI